MSIEVFFQSVAKAYSQKTNSISQNRRIINLYLNKQGRTYRTVPLNEMIVSGLKNLNIDLLVKPVKK